MEDTDFIALMPPSFLSSDVKNFLLDGGRYANHDIQPTHYFNKCGTFKWMEISSLLGNIEDDFDIHAQNYEWFATAVGKLWPVFLKTVDILGGEPCISEQFWNLCTWAGKQDVIKQQYHNLVSRNGATCVLETVLLLTAVLEHSLGKVYLLKGNNVPFLLRDLLSSQELKCTIGIIPVVFMQILFGTPQCLNLRNIVWHGFPSPDELDTHLATVLIVLVASVGEVLHREGISNSSLPSRPQVGNLHQLCLGLDELFPDLNTYHKQAANIFRNCCFIATPHKATWDVVLQHYINGRYGPSLALVLPHMEQLLRCVFCWANNCSWRLLTAQSTEFYTTCDEILAENLQCEDGNQVNAIRQVLGDNIIEMILDMFVHQAGPRIRDKMSHGECEFENIPKTFVNHVICASLAVVCSLEKLQNRAVHSDESELRDKIMKASKSYISKFHPVALLKGTIANSIDALTVWKTMPQPTLEGATAPQWEQYFKSNNSLLTLRNCLYERLTSNTDVTNESIFCDNLRYFVQVIRVETIYRPRSETLFFSLLRRIAENLHMLCIQVHNVLREKYNLHNMHGLRSRQRKTYCCILSTCPSLYVAVQCVIILVMIHLLKVNTLETLSMVKQHNLSRFLKEVLKYTENLVSCTNLEKNRWDMVQTLTTRFQQSVNQAILNELGKL